MNKEKYWDLEIPVLLNHERITVGNLIDYLTNNFDKDDTIYAVVESIRSEGQLKVFKNQSAVPLFIMHQFDAYRNEPLQV